MIENNQQKGNGYEKKGNKLSITDKKNMSYRT